MEHQIIYPVYRLLANPRVFWAISNSFDGPPGDVIQDAFYDLIEATVLETDTIEEADWGVLEVCFRMDEEQEGVFQIISDSGQAIELHPEDDGSETGSRYSTIKSMEQLNVSSHIYSHLIRSIEAVRPDLQDDIALVQMPTEANGFLKDESGDCFKGTFHLLSDSNKIYEYSIEIIDLHAGELKATVTEVN